jgi:hypothetical protein
MGSERTSRLAVIALESALVSPLRSSAGAFRLSPTTPHVLADDPCAQPAMASATETHCGHLRGNGGIYSGWAVLDNETALQEFRKLACGKEEKVGRRLTTRNHCRAEQVFTETTEKAGKLEFSAYLLWCAARCDANGQLQPIEHLGNALNRSQRLAKPVFDQHFDTRHTMPAAVGPSCAQ